MTLTTLAVFTIFAALLNGFAVAGALRFLWHVDGEVYRPDYAAILGHRMGPSMLSNARLGQSWPDTTTLDTPILRSVAPERTPIPALSWGEHDFAVDETTNALLRELSQS